MIVLSEYGITRVSGVVHINRMLREQSLLRVRIERGIEKLDAGASEAFAVANPQVAHVYVCRPERTAEVKALLEKLPGVDFVLDDEGKRSVGLDHPSSGELVIEDLYRGPVLMSSRISLALDDCVRSVDVGRVVLSHVFD